MGDVLITMYPIVLLGKNVMPMKLLGRQSAAEDRSKDIELVENKNSSRHFQAMAFVNVISGNVSALCFW